MLYIGASRNVEERVEAHRRNGLDFAGYFADQCKPGQLDALECAAIREFKPRLNERQVV